MIKTIEISNKIINDLDELFSSKIFKLCFNEKMWIGGGFARKIGHLCLGLDKKKPIDSVISYFGSIHTDVDFYCSDIKSIKNVNRYNKNYKYILEEAEFNRRNSAFYDTPFASNVDLEFRKLQRVNRSFGFVPIQLVTKFLFKNVEECFESFDITNCKYAVTKNKDKHYLHFDEKALEYDTKKELHISHTNSPYTICRIKKYIKDSVRGIEKISREKDSNKRFQELLYKVIENNWPKVYNMTTNYFVLESLKNLSNFHNLSDFELSMFIGKLTESIVVDTKKVQNYSGYGVFINHVYEERDWATGVINSRA